MFGFIKSLFGMSDRVTVASERVAVAMEGMASDLEACRARLREALGWQPAGEVIDAPAPALDDASEGKRRRGKVA